MAEDLAVFRNNAAAIDRVGEGDIGHRSEAVAHHASEHSVGRQFHCANSELLADDAIEGPRGSAALEMTEHARTCFAAGARGDERLDVGADAAETTVTGRRLAADLSSGLGARTLCDHRDERALSAAFAIFDELGQPVAIEGQFGDERDFRAAGHGAVQGQPSGVPSHHLEHEHAAVTLRSGAQVGHCLGDTAHRGIESESDVGRFKIVVDCLGHADDLHSGAGQM